MSKKAVVITFFVWLLGGGAIWGYIDWLGAQEGNSLSEQVLAWSASHTLWVFLSGAIPMLIIGIVAGHLFWPQYREKPE